MTAAPSSSPSALAVTPSGEGPLAPVVLLHGFTGSAEAWPRSVVSALSRRRRVLAVDLPGHGRSALPAPAADLGIGTVVASLVELLDSLGIERADWVGYSMGGRIALSGALAHPSRIRRLVLESASPGLPDAEARAARRESDEALATDLEARGIEWFVDHWMSQPLFASQRALPTSVREDARRRRRLNDPHALAQVLRCLGTGSQPSYWDELARLEAPLLVLTGGEDEKYELVAERIVRRSPVAEHRSIPGVGHTVHLEAPDRWTDEVIRFLDR